jgi:hypothetical protein
MYPCTAVNIKSSTRKLLHTNPVEIRVIHATWKWYERRCKLGSLRWGREMDTLAQVLKNIGCWWGHVAMSVCIWHLTRSSDLKFVCMQCELFLLMSLGYKPNFSISVFVHCTTPLTGCHYDPCPHFQNSALHVCLK